MRWVCGLIAIQSPMVGRPSSSPWLQALVNAAGKIRTGNVQSIPVNGHDADWNCARKGRICFCCLVNCVQPKSARVMRGASFVFTEVIPENQWKRGNALAKPMRALRRADRDGTAEKRWKLSSATWACRGVCCNGHETLLPWRRFLVTKLLRVGPGVNADVDRPAANRRDDQCGRWYRAELPSDHAHRVAGGVNHHRFILHHGDMAFPEDKIAAL